MTDFETPIAPESLHPVKQFYRDVIDSLTEPRFFFTHRFPKISLSYALAFAVLVNWIADFLAWLTRLVNHETLLDGFLKMRDQLSTLPIWKDLPTNLWAQQPDHVASVFPAWIAEVLGVALSPFQTLIRITLAGLSIWMGDSWFCAFRFWHCRGHGVRFYSFSVRAHHSF
jgi:hypothetical protein